MLMVEMSADLPVTRVWKGSTQSIGTVFFFFVCDRGWEEGSLTDVPRALQATQLNVEQQTAFPRFVRTIAVCRNAIKKEKNEGGGM
jgi:hypothetical protein